MSQDPDIQYVGPSDSPDRYEMVERRAAGGEGEVWRAVERHGQETFAYAVKIIHLDGPVDSDASLEALRLQAALATHVEHPALVKVREVFVGPPPHAAGQAAAPAADAASGDAGQRLYIVMKWIEGRSLQEALTRGEVHGLAVLGPLQPIAEAVDYLHSGRDTGGAPVIHRDIKPANVLLAADGRVYLVDFGLVRMRSTEGTSRIFGTAPFMAPESLARGEYTPATDRYAFGATVYYACTGELPVPGDTEGMARRLAAALGPGHEREVRGVLAMLAPSPDARPASAAEWVRALATAPPETTVGAPRSSFPTAPPPAGAPMSPFPTAPPPTGPADSPMSVPPVMSGGPTPGGPRLSPLAGGYLATPGASGGPGVPGVPGSGEEKKKRKKWPFVLGGVGVVLALALVACCLGANNWAKSFTGTGSGATGGSGASATPSYDRKQTPPPMADLRRALVSTADIAAVYGANPDIDTETYSDELRGGLTDLTLCSDPVPAGAIGGSDQKTVQVNSDQSYPHIGSSVAGFYGGEAKTFFATAKREAQKCEWHDLSIGKIGDEAFGLWHDGGFAGSTAVVIVRTGKSILEVAVETGSGTGYQAQAPALATRAAKRLPGAA
ncbi:MAG TPA: serine/threonine-protein kinase [Actinocatenispora sp.]